MSSSPLPAAPPRPSPSPLHWAVDAVLRIRSGGDPDPDNPIYDIVANYGLEVTDLNVNAYAASLLLHYGCLEEYVRASGGDLSDELESSVSDAVDAMNGIPAGPRSTIGIFGDHVFENYWPAPGSRGSSPAHSPPSGPA